MIDPTSTLDTIAFAIDDVRRATPTSPAARSAMADALSHLYMARDAVEAALRADKVTFAVEHNGRVVKVTVPE